MPKTKFKTPRVRGNLEANIWWGKAPPSKNLAWWYLSFRAKRLLQQQRAEGKFGGRIGKAPYWMSQEQGEPKAAIEPLWYIKRSLQAWEGQAKARVASYMRAGR